MGYDVLDKLELKSDRLEAAQGSLKRKWGLLPLKLAYINTLRISCYQLQ